MSDTVKSVGRMLSVAPSAAVGLAMPDPKTGIPLTGAASQGYGFMNMLSNLLTANNTGINANPLIAGESYDEGDWNKHDGVNLPGAQAVEAAGQRTQQAAEKLIPPDAPTNATERIGQEAVRGAVSMGLPIPALNKAPGIVQGLTHLLAPASMGGKAGVIANAMGAGVGTMAGVGNELDNAQQPDITLDSQPIAPNTPPDKHDGLSPVQSSQSSQSLANVPQADPLGGMTFDNKPLDDGTDALIHASGDSGLSFGRLFSYGAAFAGVVIAHKFLDTALSGAVEQARDARYNSGQDILNQDTADRAAGLKGPASPLPEVPLPPRNASSVVPDTLASASLNIREKFVDRNAKLNSFNDYMAPTPDMAENLRGQAGTLLNEGYVGTRINHIAETGHDATSNVSMPSPVDAWNRIGAWDDAKRLTLSNAEYAADELDNRKINATNGVVATDPAARVSFGAYDNAQLEAYVSAGYADPDVAFELHQNTVRNARMAEMMQGRGMIDAQTSAKFINEHPNYLPSADVSGVIADPFKARDYGNMTGPDAAYVDSTELRKQHFESVIAQSEANTAKANMIQNALDAQLRDPNLPKMFELRTNAAGDNVKGPQSVGYRVGGQLNWVDVNNSTLRNLLDRPPSAQSALVKAASQVSSISRSGTTQAIASLGGAFFQVKNAIRSTVRAGVAARPEMYTGYLDRALAQATNGNVRLPGGLDPTLYAGPIIGTAKNAYGGVLNGWLRLLDNSGPLNPFRQALQNAFGPQGYQAMIDRAKIAYANSTRGQMAEAGALNSVGFGVGEVPTSQIASRTQKYSVLNATAPELFMDKGMLGSVAPKFVRLNNLMQEVSSWVGESAHTFHFDLNKNNPALSRIAGADAHRQLAFYTRQLTGDVGQHGSSAAFRDYAAISKYMNVSVQDWANLSDAFARAPFRTTMNYATTVGLPLLASVYTAMLAGPDAINHLFNETTNDQRAANIRFYIPGHTPENSPTIPIPQTERFGTTALLQFFADMANLHAHGTNDPTYQWFKNGLEDLFSKHITNASVGGTQRGLASAGEIMLPDVAQVGMAAMTGKRAVLNPVDMALPNDIPLQKRMTAPAAGGSPMQAPNIATDNDMNAGAVTSKMFWDVIGAVFGATGSGVHQDYQAASGRLALTNDPTEAARTFVQSYMQRSVGALPFTRGVLFNAPDKLSTNTPLSESVRAAEEKYRPLLTAKSDAKYDGLTRKGGMELEPQPGAEAKIPADPQMAQLYFTAAKIGERLISSPRSPLKEVQDWQKQISAIPTSGATPEEMRTRNNAYVRARDVSLQRAAEYINDGNTELSNLVGKPVDIRKIDWKKGPEQFNSR